MRIRVRITALLLVGCLLGALLPGCGYRRAMRRAERHVDTEQWREAVVEYRNALKQKPDSVEARAGLNSVRAPALHEALADGRAALDHAQYEASMEHATFAAGLDGNHDGVARLRNDVRDEMRSRLHELVDAGAMEEAYAFADRLGALFPTADFLHAVYERLRAHFFDRASELLEQRRYAASLEQLGFIETYEPDLGDEVDRRSRVVRVAWADDLATRAGTLEEAGHAAAAAALLATAFQVARREDDLAHGRRLALGLKRRGTFTVHLEIRGEVERLEWVHDPLGEGLGAIAGAELAAPGESAWLTWTLEAGEHTCGQADVVSEGTRDYVAGQISLDNPAYLDLLEQGDRLQRDLDELTVELTGARWAVDRASRKAADHDAEVMFPLRGQIAQIRYEIQDLEARLEANADLLSEIDSRQQQLQPLLEEEEDASEHHRSLRAARDGAVYQLEILEEREAGWRTEQSQVSLQLERTPPLIFEDVIDTFHYDIHDWTRSCTTELAVGAAGRWVDGYQGSARFTSVAQTVDRCHEAYPEYGVPADPLDFETPDADLVARANLADVDQALVSLATHADEFYAFWWGEALAGRDTDPDRATEAMLMVLLGAPSRLGDRDRELIADHVLRVYGLEDLALLE